MDPALTVSNSTPFQSAQVFEQAAAVADERGVHLYLPERLFTRTGQRVTEMFLDTLDIRP